MLLFEPLGPYVVPAGAAKKKYVDKEKVLSFWKKYPKLASRTGCYIYGVRAGKGWTPYYIGKATRDFESEALSDRNLVHFVNKVLNDRTGTPILFFLAEPLKKGKANSRLIADLERYLIANAARTNPSLLNKHGTSIPSWGIKGILRSGAGKSNAAARELMRRLDL